MSNTALKSLLDFSYGATLLDLEDYEVQETPVIKPGLGRVYTNVVVRASCLLTGTDAGTFAADLAVVYESLRVDGQNLIITGLANEVEYALLAAVCMDGGPHVTIKAKSDAGPLMKRLDLEIVTNHFDPGQPTTNSFSAGVATRPDGLVTYTRSGEVIGPSSANYYYSTVLPAAKSAYPLPGYVFSHEITATRDNNQSRTSYRITAVQTAGALPSMGGSAAVEGEMTVKVDTDEQFRKLTTMSIDLLVVGDPQPLLNKMRTAMTAGGGIVLRENWQVTNIREQRLSGSFSVLCSADRSPLLNWTETTTLMPSDAGWEIKTYPGAAPIVIRRPQTVARVKQTGEAIAAGQWKKAVPRYNTHLATPEVSVTDVNNAEKKTTWNFDMYASAGGSQPDPNFDVASFDPTYMMRVNQDNNYYPGGTPAPVVNPADIIAATGVSQGAVPAPGSPPINGGPIGGTVGVPPVDDGGSIGGDF